RIAPGPSWFLRGGAQLPGYSEQCKSLVMLKITLNGTPLNIPPDLQLNLIFENPLLFNDRIPSSHSLSFDLPATAHNLRIFGNPNRLNSAVVFREYNGLDIFF